MDLKNKIATVFGGTGFIGRQVVRQLAAEGTIIKIATRIPESAYFLKPCGAVGQVVPFACDYSNESIAKAVNGSDIVVNCIGILFEKGKSNTFQNAHVSIPEQIAKACKKENVKRFVHISALGIEESGSNYAKTKIDGEKAVLKHFPKATILRPSVVFGEDDSFFNKFARLAPLVPFFPLIGGGKTQFQPVFVGDIADAVFSALKLPSAGENNPQGKIYALGGPDVVTFKDIYYILFHYIGRSRPLVNVPFPLAKIQGFFMSLLPEPLLTPDQVESLKTNNIVKQDNLSFPALGLQPTAMDIILPTYLESYRPGGRFG